MIINTARTHGTLPFSDSLINKDFGLLRDAESARLRLGGAWVRVSDLKRDSPAEHLDDESTTLRHHQQCALFTTETAKLDPHHHILGGEGGEEGRG